MSKSTGVSDQVLQNLDKLVLKFHLQTTIYCTASVLSFDIRILFRDMVLVWWKHCFVCNVSHTSQYIMRLGFGQGTNRNGECFEDASKLRMHCLNAVEAYTT